MDALWSIEAFWHTPPLLNCFCKCFVPLQHHSYFVNLKDFLIPWSYKRLSERVKGKDNTLEKCNNKKCRSVFCCVVHAKMRFSLMQYIVFFPFEIALLMPCLNVQFYLFVFFMCIWCIYHLCATYLWKIIISFIPVKKSSLDVEMALCGRKVKWGWVRGYPC